MRTFAIAALTAAALCAGARASPMPDDPPAAPAADSAKEAFVSLKAEYDKAYQEFLAAYRAATTDEERQKAYTEKSPRAEDWAPKFRAIADAHPEGAAAAECLAWIVQNHRDGKAQAEALDLLAENHLSSAVVARVCPMLEYSPAANVESFLRRVMADGPDRDAKGRACYTLARVLGSRSERAARVAEGGESGASGVEQEAVSLFEEVEKTYGDLKYGRGTLGEKAKADLFEIRNLAVGKVAPDIEGEDGDGVRFKLTDYRGKVVLLDFWGEW